MQQVAGSPSNLQSYINSLFDSVVESIVSVLGFRAAMFAVYEQIDGEERITVRAFSASVLSSKFFKDLILGFGEMITGQKLIGNYVVINDPQTQAVNQAVQAIINDQPFHVTHNLYDLFAPRVHPTIARVIQARAGVRTILTVPFRDSQRQLLGNLYAGSEEDTIAPERIRQLQGFTQLAMLAIEASNLALQNARYAQNAEKMALLASGVGNNTHRLNNLLGSLGSGLFMTIVDIVNRLKETILALDLVSDAQALLQLSQDIWVQELAALDAQTLEHIQALLSQIPAASQPKMVEVAGRILPELVRFTQQARNASQVLQGIVAEARQYAQIKTNLSVEQEQPPSRADLAQIVQQVCHSLRHSDSALHMDGYQAPETIELAYPPTSSPLWVLGDFVHLLEVVYIIAKNACQAIEGQGRVQFSYERQADELVLHIQDNGHGIARQARANLFDLKASSKAGGLGYGLWYASLTIKKYGGRISFVSTTAGEATLMQASGTTFSIALKALDGDNSL